MNDCLCMTNNLQELTQVVRMFKFLNKEYPEKKLIWVGKINKKEIIKLKNLYDFKIIDTKNKQKIYNIIASTYYMIVPSVNGIWESILGVSHGCRVLTLSKIKPFDTNVFNIKENETIYTLDKYREWVEDIKREWNCKTELNYKGQIKKIIQTNSIRNIVKKWLSVLNI